jgi:inhibitor of cysteine peptidase
MKILPIGIIITLIVLISAALIFFPEIEISKEELKKFSSYEELEDFVKTNMESYSYYGGVFGGLAREAVAAPAIMETTTTGAAEAAQAEKSEDYSTTNVQVTGVDEADIVKNDGKYIYVVSGKKVVIVDAYPADQAKILSEIELNGTAQEIFINKDKLVVFGNDYGYSKTFIEVYDVSDRSNPIIKRDVSLNGSYYDSRMIGDYVYVIINQPVYYGGPRPIPLPVIESNNELKTIAASEIYYFDFPDYSYIFTNILAINTQNDNEEFSSKTFLMGYTQNMYVSPYNIYVVYTKRLKQSDFYDRIIDEVIIPIVPLNSRIKINEIRNSNISEYEKMQQIGEIFQDYLESLGPEEAANVMKIAEEKMQKVQTEIAKEMEKTVIYKISVDKEKIEYKTNGEVPGHVLNQFSMDEYNENFRIATTTGNWRAETLNHVYILDSNLNIIGRVEDLAHGERIYSVRFMGEKGYMVTFRQIDPLFVIDLSNPNNPKVLGFLKIPGVSDYLHPYDETHIIGVGRDATEEGRMLGMKLSLFDITDVSNPQEISKYIIGESGTYSEALNDHKAFLFSKEKNLLVIPVRVYEDNYRESFQGAYVFNVDLNNGFVLKGTITHVNETAKEEEEWYYEWNAEVRRSLYMDDILYTVSNKMIKMNDLEDLNEINKVELPYEEVYGYVRGGVGIAMTETVEAPIG